jgi:hypothetical protein
LYALPECPFDTGDVSFVENLIAANRGEKGLTILIPWVVAQPFEKPAPSFTKFCGDLVNGEC